MRSDVRTATVAQLQSAGALLVEDGNHGEYRPRADEFVERGVAFIRAADMDGGRVLFSSAGGINEVAFARIRKGIGRPGDILLSHKGTVGKIALVPLAAPSFVCSPQTTFWRVLDTERIDRLYLYSYMRSPEFRAQLASRKGETDMADYVSLTAQRQLKILLPCIARQREVGVTIGALDNRIDLLRETNATLESIAQALFKSWFIDFDPVRAKQAGRELKGMDAVTAALFPLEFEESVLGTIPRGWQVGRVEDLFILQRGFDLPAASRTDGPYPVLAASGPSGGHVEKMVFGPGVTTGRSGVLGQVFFINDDFWPLNTSLWVKQFKLATPSYAYQQLRALNLAHLNAGSAVPTLNRNHVHALAVLLPSKEVVTAYDEVALPLLQRIHANKAYAHNVSLLRDALLPRLISGKLRLPEVKEAIEGVAA